MTLITFVCSTLLGIPQLLFSLRSLVKTKSCVVGICFISLILSFIYYYQIYLLGRKLNFSEFLIDLVEKLESLVRKTLRVVRSGKCSSFLLFSLNPISFYSFSFLTEL